MIIESLTIGWFGVPMASGASSGRSTNVHARNKGECLCSYEPNHRYEFQWCSSGLSGIEFVECKRCQEILLKNMSAEQKKKFKKHVLANKGKRMWSASWYRWFA